MSARGAHFARGSTLLQLFHCLTRAPARREIEFPRISRAIGEQQLLASTSYEQRSPPRIVDGPRPKRRLQPIIDGLQLGDGVGLTAYSIDPSVFQQCSIVNAVKVGQAIE